MKKQYKTAACLMMLLSAMANANAEQLKDKNEEEVPKYNLDEIVVEDARDRFGNIITEQSYYRTGGDGNVITRKEIEEHHYATATEAIKRMPGVRISSPGYRGGEYGMNGYMNSTVSINGDDRVIVCIDGRRVDNAASGLFSEYGYDSSKALVNLDQITSIDNIEKIEVIKGPGASVYGADATGGVINIITRKGALKPSGTVDIATGSWDRHTYKLNYSGSTDDGSLRYFLAVNRDMSGDTKYYDRVTKKNYTYRGTAWKDEGVNFRIDKEFDKTHNLRISYNHTNGKDGYPMTTPDYRYMSQADYLRILKGGWGDVINPGFRNKFYQYAFTGSYTAYSFNDIDVTYSFNKDHDMESFVRVYNQSHTFYDNWGGFVAKDKDGNKRPADLYPGDPAWDYWAGLSQVDVVRSPKYNKEDNRGIQFQLGKSYGKHDVLIGMTYDRANHKSWSKSNGINVRKEVDRNTYRGYVQDKIHLSDKWELTPSVRYEHYDAFKTTEKGVSVTENNSTNSIVTYAVNTQYAFDDKSSAYLGWTRINRPLAIGAYVEEDDYYFYKGQKLQDEKGNALTLGLRKDFSTKTSGSINYNYLNMSNAVSALSVWDDEAEAWNTKAVNAKQKRQAINFDLQHHFDDNWSVGASYAYVKEDWKAKNGIVFRPGLQFEEDLVNAYINAYRPTNQYMLDLNYQKDKWNVLLSTSYYTGCSQLFTNNRFLVMDLNLNYQINKDISAYLQVGNLTNEGYELFGGSYHGLGAFAQPGRSFLIGMKYKF